MLVVKVLFKWPATSQLTKGYNYVITSVIFANIIFCPRILPCSAEKSREGSESEINWFVPHLFCSCMVS
jgi:hypothetical protein